MSGGCGAWSLPELWGGEFALVQLTDVVRQCFPVRTDEEFEEEILALAVERKAWSPLEL